MTGHAALLREVFDATVRAARPESWLAPELARLGPAAGGTRVLCLGKAAIPMAHTAAATVRGKWSGLAIAPIRGGETVAGFSVMEGAHPVPDETSLAAGEAALAFAAGTGPDDRLLLLISGGASAMACAPVAGLLLARKAALTRTLLGSGADIAAINTVRRALSRLKGGGLARAAQGEVVTVAMSDVPGDRLHDIGSGPGVASPTGVEAALAVVREHAPHFLDLAEAMRAHEAARGVTPPVTARVAFRLGDAIGAARTMLEARGWPVLDLGAVAGEARAVAASHAALARPGSRLAILSGGELSVSLGDGPVGRGGRNQEYLLALALALAGRSDIHALAADTDGRDGSEPVAGAMLDPALLSGLDRAAADAALDAHDACSLFERHGRLLVSGPTGVNVGDLRVILVEQGANA